MLFPASPLQWGCRGGERSAEGDREGVGSSAGQGSPSGVDRRSYFRGMLDHFQDKKDSLLDTMGYPHGKREYPGGSRNRPQGMKGSLHDNQAQCQGRGR